MIDLAWIVTRGVSFALLLQAVGAALFAAYFAPLAPRSLGVVAGLARRAAAGALIAVLAQYLLETARLGGELSGVLDATLHRVLLSSSLGAALAVRLAGLTCLAAVPASARPLSRSVMLAGVLLATGSFVLTGHTWASERHRLLAPLLLLHLLILSFWFGALWPLARATQLETPSQAARLLHSFSAWAVWLVPLTGLAGVLLAAALLPDLAALRRPYGLLLIGKALAFALLMGLAGLNRLRLVPALARGEHSSAGRLRVTIAFEYLLLCTALALTVVMTGFFSPS